MAQYKPASQQNHIQISQIDLKNKSQENLAEEHKNNSVLKHEIASENDINIFSSQKVIAGYYGGSSEQRTTNSFKNFNNNQGRSRGIATSKMN